MPEHVHLLLTPGAEITLERALQLIKGGSSHAMGAELGRKGEVWQRGFTDHRIRNGEDFERHREYIHRNPVARKIAHSAGGVSLLLSVSGLQVGRMARSG